MKTVNTTFKSNQNNVSDFDVKKAYENLELKKFYGVKELILYNIDRTLSGRGHYKVTFDFIADGKAFTVFKTTTNLELINDFDTCMGDYITDFKEEEKSDIVNTMLGLASDNLADKIDELN